MDRKRFTERVKQSDAACFHYTGVVNVNTLWYVYVQILPFVAPHLTQLADNVSLVLDSMEQFLFTLVRVRTGSDLRFLSFLFGVSEEDGALLFAVWTRFLAELFSDLIVWPGPEAVAANLPESFRRDFPQTVAVVDLAEYRVIGNSQSENEDCCDDAVVRQLVCVMPTGCITYVSDVCETDTDPKLFGFVDRLNPGEDVMCNRPRGWPGEDRLKEMVLSKGARLNIKCSSSSTVPRQDHANTLPSGVVSVAIERMKGFRILGDVMPQSVRLQLNDVTKIVAFLSNLQPNICR